MNTMPYGPFPNQMMPNPNMNNYMFPNQIPNMNMDISSQISNLEKKIENLEARVNNIEKKNNLNTQNGFLEYQSSLHMV